ncbi:MAG: hypothetical protein CSA22_00340 [Deltaproteobacteria bacterium]|nr:MAG: hypothetical protein CSA22_00340 [Deltaproteobacteria bacterium]
MPIEAEDWYHKALEVHDLVEIPVTGEIALRSASLPFLHKDPADRIIIATAKLHHLPIVTHDNRFEHYSVTVQPMGLSLFPCFFDRNLNVHAMLLVHCPWRSFVQHPKYSGVYPHHFVCRAVLAKGRNQSSSTGVIK